MMRYSFECGPFSLVLDFKGDVLVRLSLLGDESLPPLPPCQAKGWLEGYFQGKEEALGLPPLALEGSAFETGVWRSLLRIPRGRVMTYASFAEMAAGSRRYARAVGEALGRNPLPLLYPCHRVIASDGALGGFLYGAKMKKALLLQEGVIFLGDKVVLGEGTIFLP